MSEEEKTALKDAIIVAMVEELGDTAYYCTRVWEAWSVGTMREDDFVSLAHDDDAMSMLADAVIRVIEARKP